MADKMPKSVTKNAEVPYDYDRRYAGKLDTK